MRLRRNQPSLGAERSAALTAAPLWLALVASCAGDTGAGTPDRTPDDANADSSVEIDAVADAEPDEGSDAVDRVDAVADVSTPDGSGADAQVDAAASDTSPDDAGDDTADIKPEDAEPDVDEGPEVVRFIIIGDTGEGNEEQYAVARAAAAHCDRAGGCHGIIMLGDNIYDEGPSSDDDPLFGAYIDEPYRVLKYGPPPADGEEDTRERLPIYMTLGNHDLGGAGLETALIQHYLAYALANDFVYFPAPFYEIQIGPVHLVSLHTNPLAYLGTELAEQGALVDRVVASTDATWTIVFGHHPYRSDGPHGNAGSYEGIPGDLLFLGGKFREFVDDHICNDVDFYFSGHDHSRQWVRSVPDIPTWPVFPPPTTTPCNTRFAVSGAGAKSSEIKDRDNDMAFTSLVEGYLFMEFTETDAYAQFCDMAGTCDWEERYER
jgi:hypothetical protein